MKVISGGQTGVDRGSLEGAKDAGVETGGYAPCNFKTETGFDMSLKEFGLIDSGLGYVGRTELNAKYSDGTIWIGKADSTGYIATRKACVKAGKIFLHHKSVEDSVHRIELFDWSTINFAGSRESKFVGIQKSARKIVYDILMELKKKQTTLDMKI